MSLCLHTSIYVLMYVCLYAYECLDTHNACMHAFCSVLQKKHKTMLALCPVTGNHLLIFYFKFISNVSGGTVCVCHDDEAQGHWTGDSCEQCAVGWRAPSCTQCDTGRCGVEGTFLHTM